MKAYICFIALACTAAAAAADPLATGGSEPASELSFLKPGKDYSIRFPESVTVFSHKSGGLAPTNYIAADGTKTPAPPATWSATMTLQIFHVVRLGSGSWALLEHPTRHDDFITWSIKRRAMAVCASEEADKIEAQPDGKKRLEQLRKEAAQEVETSQTWVNLDHAVAIADLPTKEQKLKLAVQSVETKPSK